MSSQHGKDKVLMQRESKGKMVVIIVLCVCVWGGGSS